MLKIEVAVLKRQMADLSANANILNPKQRSSRLFLDRHFLDRHHDLMDWDEIETVPNFQASPSRSQYAPGARASGTFSPLDVETSFEEDETPRQVL